MKKCLLLYLVMFNSLFLAAQVGGNNIYSFLNLPNSSRVLALGGSTVARRDGDVNMAYQNPGLINTGMDKHLSFSFVKYFAGINFGNAAYAFNAGKAGTAAVSMQYINYGTFQRADNTGLITGEFTAGEYCLTTGFGHSFDSLFTVGVNLKTIFSNLESYNSFGMALDFGASFRSRDKLFEMGIVMRNFGYQFDSYVDGYREELPLELQLGLSKGFEHVPLRFSLVGQQLQKPDLTFQDPRYPEESVDPITGDTVINKIGLGNKIMRHIIAGAELNITKNIVFRLGYNFLRRQELMVETRPKTVGLSWGLGINVYKFSLSYARSAYHLAGSPNHFTLAVKLSEFYRKQQ